MTNATSTNSESPDFDNSLRSTQNHADPPISVDLDDSSLSKPTHALRDVPAPPSPMLSTGTEHDSQVITNPASISGSTASSEEDEWNASVIRFRNNNVLIPAVMYARRMKLDALDPTLLPEWLREPVKYLVLKFRGKGEVGEDNLLKLWIAAEVLWEHSKVCLTFSTRSLSNNHSIHLHSTSCRSQSISTLFSLPIHDCRLNTMPYRQLTGPAKFPSGSKHAES